MEAWIFIISMKCAYVISYFYLKNIKLFILHGCYQTIPCILQFNTKQQSSWYLFMISFISCKIEHSSWCNTIHLYLVSTESYILRWVLDDVQAISENKMFNQFQNYAINFASIHMYIHVYLWNALCSEWWRSGYIDIT